MVNLDKNENNTNSVFENLKRQKKRNEVMRVKRLFWLALAVCIIGVCLALFGNVIGVGLITAAIVDAILAIIRALKLIRDKFEQTEDRIKKLEEEIEFLKNR